MPRHENGAGSVLHSGLLRGPASPNLVQGYSTRRAINHASMGRLLRIESLFVLAYFFFFIFVASSSRHEHARARPLSCRPPREVRVPPPVRGLLPRLPEESFGKGGDFSRISLPVRLSAGAVFLQSPKASRATSFLSLQRDRSYSCLCFSLSVGRGSSSPEVIPVSLRNRCR